MLRSRRGRCDLVLEAQEENGAEGPVFSQYRASERQFVVRDDYPLGQRRLTSLSGRVLDVGSVDGQNDVTHFVDELEDRVPFRGVRAAAPSHSPAGRAGIVSWPKPPA